MSCETNTKEELEKARIAIQNKLAEELSGKLLDNEVNKANDELDKITYGSSEEHDGEWRAKFDRMTEKEQQKLNKWSNSDEANSDFTTLLSEAFIGQYDNDENKFVTEMLFPEDQKMTIGENGPEVSSYFEYMYNLGNKIGEAVKENGIDLGTQFEVYDTDEEFSRADFNPANRKIRLFRGKNKSQISSDGELMAHEVTHMMTEFGIQLDNKLARRIEVLKDSVVKEVDKKFGGKGMGYKALLSDISEPSTDEVYRAKELWDKYITSGPSEFMAYMNTNKGLIEAVNGIEVNPETIKKFDIDSHEKGLKKVGKSLFNVFANVVNLVLKSSYFAGVGADGKASFKARDVLDTFSNNLMRLTIAQEVYKKNGGKGKILSSDYLQYGEYGWADMLFGAKQKYISVDKMIGVGYRKANRALDKITPKLKNGWHKIEPLAERMLDNKLGRILNNSRTIMDQLNTAIIPTNSDRYAWKYQGMRQSNYDSESSEIDLRVNAEKNFNKVVSDLNDNEKIAMVSMLETEWWKAYNNMNDLARDIKDRTKIKNKIDKLVKEIGNDRLALGARDLGWWLVHKENKSELMAKNAYTIVENEVNSEMSTIRGIADVIENVDKLSTLFGLYYTSKQDRESIASAIAKDDGSEMSPVTYITNFYDSYKKKDTLLLNSGIKYVEKGYVRRGSTVMRKFDILPESAFNGNGKWGTYKKGAEVKELSKYKGVTEKFYYVVKRNFEPGKTQGTLRSVNMVDTSGIKSIDQMYDGSKYTFEMMDKLKKIFVNKQDWSNITKDNIKNGSIVYDDEHMINIDNKMAVIRDINGKIINLGVEVPSYIRKDKEHGLVENEGIAAVLANTATAIDLRSVVLNNNLKFTDMLIEDSKLNSKTKGYVYISPDSKNARLKKAWTDMPNYVRTYITNKTGKSGLFVDNDFIINLNGYNDMSLTNLKVKGKKLSDYPKVTEALHLIGDGWKEIIREFKSIVVKYNPRTIMGNAESNMLMALQFGIGPVEYAQEFTSLWSDLAAYEKTKSDLIIANLDKMAGVKGIDTKIRSLENLLKSNTFDTLLKDGQYTTILEDIDNGVTLKQTNLEEFIEKNFSKLVRHNESAEYIKDLMYLNKNTTAGQFVEKLTSYNDIINREIIRRKLESKVHHDIATGKLKGERHIQKIRDKNLAMLDMLFVNYAYLDTSLFKYLNDLGGIMFTKYKFRALKASIMRFRDNPTAMIGYELIDNFVVDMSDPLDQYWSPLQSINRSVMSINPIDAFSRITSPRVYDITGL